MKELRIGEVIQKRRKELGLTQAEVCEGICEPMTLSRIENGKQAPSYNRVKAILHRLALPEDRYVALLDEDEIKLEDLKKEASARVNLIRNASAQAKPKLWREALASIQALEEFAGGDPLTRQSATSLRVSLGKPEGPYSLEEKLELLLSAIRLTRPKFDLEEINGLCYSDGEMSLIIRIANAYSLAGEKRKALDIYGQLVKYAQKHGWDQPRYADNLTVILHNYARELNIDKRYEEALEIAQMAWRISVKYNDYRCLGGLLSIQAYSYAYLGEVEKSKDLYYQTLYLYKALGDPNGITHLKDDAKDALGIELDWL